MTKMLVIAPYKGLDDLFLEVNKTAKKNMDVEVGNLYKGVMIAKALENNDYDVIISRGATAKVIREQSKLPVVDLQFSGYDILRTMLLVQGYKGKIGIMSFFNIAQGADVVGTLLGMDVKAYPIHYEEEIETMVKRAKQEGIQMIIGDVITTAVAERYGINSTLITSGREAVIDSIERAEELVFYTKKEQKIRSAYKQVLQKCTEGIIIVDKQAVCLDINEKAEDFLDVNQQSLVGEKFNDEIPFVNFKQVLSIGKEESFSNIYLNNNLVDIEKYPIKENGHIEGAAIIIKDRSTNNASSLDNTITEVGVHFSNLITNSIEMDKLVKSAKRLSKSKLPLIIYGEEGTGKKSLAQAIHNEGDYDLQRFHLLNCDSYNSYQIEEVIFGTKGYDGKKSIFEVIDHGTLCIENILSLPLHHQKRLSKCIEEKAIDRGFQKIPFDIRIIILSSYNLSPQVEKGLLHPELLTHLQGYHLTIPPLRNRKDDLKDLIRTFIGATNGKLGKQIVGFEDNIMEKLYSYEWPGNVKQLKRTVEQMCFISDGPFVKEEEVLNVIKGLEANNELTGISIDLTSKTLDQIINEIILHVMEEEDQNQSKVAKRLGINRSTLWRKLKTL